MEAAGRSREVQVSVRDCEDARPLHFANDIVPLLTRHGCNAGGCHGKALGQNGFKLSLFGFDPRFDYHAIVTEARGRRVFPAAPDNSLLLTKPAGRVPHGGGKRLTVDGEDYQTLRRWIVQGTPVGAADAPTLQRIEVLPKERVLSRNGHQQLVVLAHHSDGLVRDVTRHAQYLSNETPVAVVEENGLVRTLDLSGEAAVMARYQGQVAVFRAIVPVGKPLAHAPDFACNNYIDELCLAKWKQLGLVPSALCTDEEFCRRAHLDICGRLPAVEDVKAFLQDAGPQKRSLLIDKLLEDKDYAAYSAMRWGTLLHNKMNPGTENAAYAFHEWIREHFARNLPYDEFVRGIIAASGEWQEAPAVNRYQHLDIRRLHEVTGDTVQLFLGLRLQCAQCHHHPYERWSQDDYYGLAGFFNRMAVKPIGENPQPIYSARVATYDLLFIHNPRTGKPPEPKLLDGPPLVVPPDQDPRHKLVDWLARPDNPYFARAFVNRVWGHYLGRGLVDPIDDLRETNPPSNPALLDALAKDFIRHKFDMKYVVRLICSSRRLPAQLHAERLQPARQAEPRPLLRQAPGGRGLAGCPGPRLRHADIVREDAHHGAGRRFAARILQHRFHDRQLLPACLQPPAADLGVRVRAHSGANLAQVLHLLNAPEIEGKIHDGNGRAARLAQAKIPLPAKVEELYLATFSRRPRPDELAEIVPSLAGQKDERRALEDVLWSLLNSKEFAFIR